MSEHPSAPPEPPSSALSPDGGRSDWFQRHRLGWIPHVIAWFVVTIFSLLIMVGSMMVASDVQSDGAPQLPINHELTGRVLIGANQMLDGERGGMLMNQAMPMRTGPFLDQLAHVVLQSELIDAPTAIDALEELKATSQEDLPRTEAETEVAELVGVLLFAAASGERADALPMEQRAKFDDALGIYGAYLHARATGDRDALLTLEQQAKGVVIGAIFFGLWFLAFFAIGIVVILVLVIRLLMRSLTLHLTTAGASSKSIYIETFAVWLFLHIAFQAVGGWLTPKSWGIEGSLLIALIASFSTLIALFWPCIRGVSFAQVRQDCGLVGGRSWFIEVLAGFATYASALPILLVGVVLSAILGVIVTFLFGEMPPPSHPIQDAIGDSLLGIVLIYLVACVAAPVVEEIMFRGVLYRYCRDGTRRMAWILSFGISALLSSFIFAAIHPQGITFIPILGALAVAFCIGREWRGSLIAPITAHAISNGVVMTLNVVVLT